MRNIDTSIYSAEKPSRIKPDEIDLSDLPRIEKPLMVQPIEQPGESVQPDQHPASEETERYSVRKNERTEKRSPIRSESRTGLPIKRKTKRYSFEFYDDQLTRLKRLKSRVEVEGNNISLSDIVRQALDHYLQKQGE